MSREHGFFSLSAMSNRARIISGIAAVVVIVGAFVILNGSSDSDKPSKTVTVTQTEATGGVTVEKTTTTAVPEIDTIVVKDAKPVGGVNTLSFANGDQIKFKVDSDTADEIHVHGYDLAKDVAAGGSVTFSFKATIEGVFEIELEEHGVEIASLKVTP